MTTQTETYDVRGRTVQFEYDGTSHTATIQSPGIGKDTLTSPNPQAVLDGRGIDTTIQDVVAGSRDSVTVRLKPASGVAFRKAPEEGNTLQARPVSNQFDGHPITKRNGSYSYKVSVSRNTLDEVGLESGDQAATYVELRDGQLCLRVEPTEAPHSMSTRCGSTGTLGLPNGLAAAAGLDGHGVRWDVVDGGSTLMGETTFEPPAVEFPAEVDDPNAHPVDRHYMAPISYVTQEMSTGDRSWTQSHFNAYVRSDIAPTLDWRAPKGVFDGDERLSGEDALAEYVDIHLVNIGGKLGLYVTDRLRLHYIDEVTGDKRDESENKPRWEVSVNSAPCIRKLYKNSANGQLTFSVPTSLAHAMEFTDEWPSKSAGKEVARGKRVKWAIRDGGILGKPVPPEPES